MRYSKIFHVEGEEAEDFIKLINDNSAKSLMNILKNSVESDWNEDHVFSEIPIEDKHDQYNEDNYILTWEEETPMVCLYIDSEETEEALFDYDDEEEEESINEEYEGKEIVTEALDDSFLIDSIKKLQEGDVSDYEISVAKRVKELTIKYMNGELK